MDILLLKIKAGKFSMQFSSSFVIGNGGFFGRGKVSEIVMDILVYDLGVPFFSIFHPAYSYVATGIPGLNFSVTGVLRCSSFPQIFSAIVQSVVVTMVWLFFWFTPKDFYSHLNQVFMFAYMFFSFGIKAFCIWVPTGIPRPLVEPVVISGSDLGALSLSQGNNLVGWIQRLDNFVSYYTTFWHGLSFTKVLLPAAILAY